MINDPLTAPAGAYAPDANRDSTAASARMPQWLIHLIARLIRFMLERVLATRAHRARLPAWWNLRADLPKGSVQQLAAAIRGEFGNAIAWTCRRRGIGPGHPDWPEISRAIVAFGGSLAGFRPGLPACGLQWWENPAIVPGMIGETAATPAADAVASLLSRQIDNQAPPPATVVVPAETARATPPAPRRSSFPRASTGPPTGPPTDAATRPVCLNQRGRSTAGPAIRIRAEYVTY